MTRARPATLAALATQALEAATRPTPAPVAAPDTDSAGRCGMTYLARLRETEKNLGRPLCPTAKTDRTPPDGSFGSFGSTPPGPFQNFTGQEDDPETAPTADVIDKVEPEFLPAATPRIEVVVAPPPAPSDWATDYARRFIAVPALMAVPAAAPAAVRCADCAHYLTDPVGWGGLGRCAVQAPASLKAGSLWANSTPVCPEYQTAVLLEIEGVPVTPEAGEGTP